MANSETVAQPEAGSTAITLAARLSSIGLRAAFLIAFVGATLIFAQYRPWDQPSLGDRANWDYFSQVIARRGVPYRDVVNIKSPLAAYIGAGAILMARPFGIRDVSAIRIAYIFLMALVVGCTLTVAVRYENDAGVGVAAAAAILCFDTFVTLYNAGVQPKTPMVLFGLITLWAVERDRPFLAGSAGMLSALSWQPGLLFVGVAILAFSKYLTSWRDLRAIRVLLGAAFPLAVVLVYFWSADAIRDFYLWNIDFNATVYGPNELRTISGSIRRLGRIIDGDYTAGRVFFYAALPGVMVAIVREFRRARGSIREFVGSAPRHSIIVSALAYVGFCMIDMQGGADLIPLLPFAAIFSAILFGSLLNLAVKFAKRIRPALETSSAGGWGRVIICTGIIAFAAGRAFSYRLGYPTLKDQDAEVKAITSHLEASDKIFVHGNTEVLVLSGLTNASKHFLLDRGKDEYIDAVEPGGFDGWLERLKAEKPKVVLLGRLGRVTRRDSLEQWVAQDYDRRDGRLFTYYLRRGN